jgi:hypothetical protein
MLLLPLYLSLRDDDFVVEVGRVDDDRFISRPILPPSDDCRRSSFFFDIDFGGITGGEDGDDGGCSIFEPTRPVSWRDGDFFEGEAGLEEEDDDDCKGDCCISRPVCPPSDDCRRSPLLLDINFGDGTGGEGDR